MSSVVLSPKTVVIGTDALRKSSKYIIDYGKKAFIVTDEKTAKTKAMRDLKCFLNDCDIGYFEYAGIRGEVDDSQISQGRKLYDYAKCDFVIGAGGGSVMDGAKGIAIPADNPLAFYKNKEVPGNTAKIVAMLSVPLGGTEINRFALIGDSMTETKMMLKGDGLIPELVVINPHYSVTAPLEIVIESAMETLVLAIESFLSTKSNDISNIYAIQAIRKVFEYLPKAIDDFNDLECREQLAAAAYHAGMATNNTSAGLISSMAVQLGSVCNLPKSKANVLVMLPCLEYLARELKDEFRLLAGSIKKRNFIDELRQLFDSCSLTGYNGLNIKEADQESNITRMAYETLMTGGFSNLGVTLSQDILVEIFHDCLI